MSRNYLDQRKEAAPFHGAEATCLKVLVHREHGIGRDGTKACEAGAE